MTAALRDLKQQSKKYCLIKQLVKAAYCNIIVTADIACLPRKGDVTIKT